MDIDKMFAEPTDEEVAQFLKEFDEGKHPLSDEAKSALSTVGFRRSLVFSQEISRLKKANDALTAQLEEARRALERQIAFWDRDGDPCKCGTCSYCGMVAALAAMQQKEGQ